MKKFVLLLLAVMMVAAAVPASGETFTTLRMLQDYIYKTSPRNAGEPYAELEGTIESIEWAGANNHYNMTLLVDDPKALVPIGEETPRLTVHFRLHVDPIPFQVGDTITVFGSLNSFYSSVMVPYILAKFINGNDNF